MLRPATFDYHRPSSVTEAVQLLSANPGAKAIAGGHSLLPAMNLRLATPDTLVDIGRIAELQGISVSNGALRIGALTTHSDVAGNPDVKTHCPALSSACSQVGDPQVRNWGTLGGNLAHADPASDPPTVAVASNATIHVQGPTGARSINAENFFVDLFTTDLQPGELVTAIEIPSQQGKKSGYAKLEHPASRYAVVGVCVVLELSGTTCQNARVAVGGATAKATRSTGAEAALNGTTLDGAALDAAANALINEVGDNVLGDIYANADYRRAMVGVYLRKAVQAALA